MFFVTLFTSKQVAIENGYTETAAALPVHAYDDLAAEHPVHRTSSPTNHIPPYATEQTVLDQEFVTHELKSKLAIMRLREEDGCSVDSLGLNHVQTHVSTMFDAPVTVDSVTHTSAELDNVLDFAARAEACSSDGGDDSLARSRSDTIQPSPGNPPAYSSASPDAVHAMSPAGASPTHITTPHINTNTSATPNNATQINATSPTHNTTTASPTHINTGKMALSKLVEFPGDPAKLKTLLEDANIALNGKDMYGITALMKFAAWNKVDLLHLLLPHLNTEEVNTTGGKQRLPLLHYCVDMGANSTLTVLVDDYRVDQCAVDEHNRTFRQHARHVGKGKWLADVLGEEYHLEV